MKMDKDYVYPKSLNEINRGTIYQVLDPITYEWSNDKIITHMCNSTQIYMRLLIKRKGIRIIINKSSMEEKFSLTELVSFGNYLLSDERVKLVVDNHPDDDIALFLSQVSDADVANWKEKNKI